MFFRPPNAQSMQNMHKKHIFYQKNNASKILFYQPTYPIFFWLLQETNNIFFLA